MSLYGGISFSAKAKQATEAPATPAQPANAAAPSSSTPAQQPQDDPDKPKPAAWSASLRFAPTVRKKATPSTSKPGAAALKSVFGAVEDDAPASAPAGAAGAPRMAAKGKASLLAQPVKALPKSKWGSGSSQAHKESETIKPFAPATNTAASASSAGSSSTSAAPIRLRARRVIAVPPSMTLDDDVKPVAGSAGDDVNGFKATEAGKKLAQMEKKRTKKKGKGKDDPALAFADVPYDPARPCDYAAYKTHVRLARAQRKLEQEEEDRRRRDREGSASGSSYYSEDEREKEEEPANKKARFFAPPTSYDDAPSASSSSGPAFPPPASYDPPSAPSRDESGDDAYARRVAMSTGAAAPSFRPPAFQAASSSSSAAPPAPPPSFAPASRDESGEEAYQRRLAMSSAPRAEETGEEAYQRRLAMSRGGPPAPSPAPPAGPSSYHGRAAPPPPPPFVPSATAPAFTPSSYPPAPPPAFISPSSAPPPPPPGFVPPPSDFAPPSFDPSSAAAGGLPPFRPPSHPSSGSATPLSSAPGGAAAGAAVGSAVDVAQAKAREIAARLSKLGGAFAAPPPTAAAGVEGAAPAAYPGFAPAGAAGAGIEARAAPAGPPAEPDNRTFAERMMSKYGWEQGKGLGAAESGMTDALSVQKAPAAPTSKKQAKKEARKAEQQGLPPPLPVAAKQGMAARSVVVDASRDERLAAQRESMGGEASRVVLLTNLCGPDEVDEDLPGEVAEEANKFGLVERCFVRLVPGETREDEAVRIFLVMSGIAGGYNAVKNFDNRFFGGRTVKARFYDEGAFRAANYTL
ncbi:hypothetical protein JCM8097_008630 [Rhodosporidiobolus ruineniae]